VQAAQIQDIRVVVNAIGSIAASNTAVVRAQVSGVLQALTFQEGQQVKAGHALATIDPRAFQAILSQTQGALARDQAQLANAKIDLQRYKDLLGKEAIPKQQLDTQLALVRQLEGTVRVDQAAVDSAQLQLSYTRVVAPISGRVGLKQVDLGNVVQPGDVNGIVSIAQTRPIALVFAVPSAQVPKIMDGLHSKKTLNVEAISKEGAKLLAQGHVATIDNAIDPSTDTIKVKAIFPNTDDSLFPNQSVSVRLQLDTLKNALTVPTASVLRGAQGFYVYVANTDGTVSTRPIKPGVAENDWTAIEGDVKAGERIVVDGVDRLRNGAKVEVIDAATKGKLRADRGTKGDSPTTQGGKPEGRTGKPAVRDTPPNTTAAVAPRAPVTPATNDAPDAAPQRHKWADSLSDSDKEMIKKMSPEERHAWFQKMRSQQQDGSKAAPSPSN
jgi:multidrug efflux system membrane fusion protein